MIQLFFGWDFETRHAHALWIDALEYMSDGPILATCVHRLQDDQYFMLVFGI